MSAGGKRESATLLSGRYTLRMRARPFACALSDSAQNHLIWLMKAVRIRPQGDTWRRANRAELSAVEADRLTMQLTAEDGSAISLEVTLAGDLVNILLEADVNGAAWLAVDLQAWPDEQYLGFGERFDSQSQRGKRLDLWVMNGASGGVTYKPVPFYLSQAGYGLHVDTDVRCVVYMATADEPDTISIRNAAPVLKMTVIPGQTPREILSRYTAIAGRPAVPPAWVFGPWKSRDWQTADQPGIEEDVERQRELDLPATVKLIDARWEAAYHTFAFDPAKFPDPQDMIDQVHAHGSRLVLWISPWMAVGNENDPDDAFFACAARGYLIKNRAGEVYLHRLGNDPTLVGSCIDFTNPEAIAWWQGQICRLVEMGVSGFNTDFGEQVPEDAVFYDGRTGREMHNIYPRLYNEITYEAMQVGQPGVLLARSAWHGSQRLSAVWAGDQTSDFAYHSGLRTAIVAGLSAGLSGFPYWASDIGGYFGTPTDETYMRWTQFGAFCPIMMIHGAGPREPWAFSDQSLRVYRRYARLHTDLFPYIYACAQEASQTGIPLMRAMPLEFPDDPAAWGDLAEHQYCFGAELLVAPVYYGYSRTRLVYLPEGLWRDFWTGELLRGGRTLRCAVDVEQIPVFARAGALIPRLDPSPHTLLPAAREGMKQAGDDLRLDLYPGSDGWFRLCDGTEFVWNEASRTLAICGSPVSRQVSVRHVGGEPGRFAGAECAGTPLCSERGSLNGETEYERVTVDARRVVLKWQGPNRR
jgi:alpha-D-xyloside xylohydrolase